MNPTLRTLSLLLLTALSFLLTGCPDFGAIEEGNDDVVNGADGIPPDGEDPANCTDPKPEDSCVGKGVCAGKEVPWACVQDGEDWSWQCDPSGVEGYQADDTKCDGLDSDCDGVPDEEELTRNEVCPDQAANGVCKAVEVICDKGEHVCDFAGLVGEEGPLYVETEGYDELDFGRWCDNLDNDCDGEVDENHLTWQGYVDPLDQDEFEKKTCPQFVGVCAGEVNNEGEAWYLEETPLFVQCFDGELKCAFKCPDDLEGCDYGEVLAAAGFEHEETKCDGLDNDCDGLVDEVFDVEQSDCPHLGVCAGKVDAVCKNLNDAPEDDPIPGWACIFDPSLLLDPDFEYVDLAACQGQPGCGAESACDGLDNDCDGLVDEGLQWPQHCFQQDLDGTVIIDCVDEECAQYHPECVGSAPMLFGDCPIQEKVELQGVPNVWVPVLEADGSPVLGGVCSPDDDGHTDVRMSCESLNVDTDDEPETNVWMCEYSEVAGYNATEGAGDAEWCDGLDNNCDGVVDGERKKTGSTVYITADQPSPYVPCRNLGACDGHWSASCNLDGEHPGQWYCEYDSDDIEAVDPNNPDCDPGFANCLWSETRCDGLDNDCDGLVDELLDGLKAELDVACAGKFTGVCTEETLNTVCADKGNGEMGFVCSFDKVPGFVEEEAQMPEYCDALDNDCDGLVDEEIVIYAPSKHQQYNTGCLYQGVCAQGAKATCGPAEEPEPGVAHWECDYSQVPNFEGKVVDAGVKLYEVECDGLDNDCDGLVDEELDQDLAWAAELNPKKKSGCPFKGVCSGEGSMLWDCELVDNVPTWTCTPIGLGALYEVDEETKCDGVDNDCDGVIDEDLHDISAAGANCKTLGVCAVGGVTAECISEEGVADWQCFYDGVANYDESVEVTCDGMDNDCDGFIDEDLDWKESNACTDVGVCDSPALDAECLGEEGWYCLYNLIDDYQETESLCDQKDNDCDGAVDELSCQVCEPCSENDACTSGICLSAPDAAEEPDEEYCSLSNNYCVLVDPYTDACKTVPNGDYHCVTKTQRCLCGQGIWYCSNVQPCSGNTPICYNGECKACIPGEMSCDGNNILACKLDGSGWQLQGICGAGYICVGDGKCVSNAEFKVNTQNLSDSSIDIHPKVAARQSGGFAIVYWARKFPAGNSSDVVMRLYNDSLEPQGLLENIVNPAVSGAQENPDVALIPDNDGGFVVVWEDDNAPGEETEGNEIVGQILDDNGVKIGDRFTINTTWEGEQEAPAVAAFHNGTFLVVWEHDVPDSADAPEVFGQAFYADGSKFGPEFRANNWVPGSQRYPAISNVAADGYVVSWSSQGQVDNYDIFFQLYDETLSPIMAEQMANIYSVSAQNKPAVDDFSGLLAGGFASAWESFGQEGAQSIGIFMNYFDEEGSPVSGPDIPVNTLGLAGNQRDPDVAVLSDNTVVVVWETPETNDLTDTPDGDGVVARTFDDSGAGLIDYEFLVNQTNSGKQANPAVAPLPGRGYVVVWFSQPDALTYNVAARVFKIQ